MYSSFICYPNKIKYELFCKRVGRLISVHINLQKVTFHFLFPEVLRSAHIDLRSWWPEYCSHFLSYISLFTKSKNKPIKCSVEISPETIIDILDLPLYFVYLIKILLKQTKKWKKSQTTPKKDSCWQETNLFKQSTPKCFHNIFNIILILDKSFINIRIEKLNSVYLISQTLVH